jgi:hypothetical protein
MSILRAPGWAARIDETLINEAPQTYFGDLNKYVEMYAAKYYSNSIETGSIDRTNKLIIKMLRFAIIRDCTNKNDEFAAKIGQEDSEARNGGELSVSDVDGLINITGDATFTGKSSDFAIGDMIYFARKGDANISFKIDGANVIKNENTDDGINGMILVKNTQDQFLAFNDFVQQYKILEKEATGLFDAMGNRIRHGVVEHRISLQKIYDLKIKGFGSKVITTAANTLIENLKSSVEGKPTDYMQDVSTSIWAHKATLASQEYVAKRGGDEATPDVRFKVNEWSKVLSKINGVTAKIKQEEETPIKEDKLKALQLLTAILQKFNNIIADNDDVAEGIISAVETLRMGSASDFVDQLIENLSVLTYNNEDVAEMYEEIVNALTSYKESVKLTRQQTDRLLQEQYIKRKQFAYRMEELFRG